MQQFVRFDPKGHTVYPKKFAHGICFAVLCCGYTLTNFPISIRLTSLALWQSNDCPSASKATLMNMDKYFMWIHYEGLHNHNKAKHNKTVCIFLGIYCTEIHSYSSNNQLRCLLKYGHLNRTDGTNNFERRVRNTNLAPVPLSIFRSNSKFDENSECSSFRFQ